MDGWMDGYWLLLLAMAWVKLDLDINLVGFKVYF
jgi:hypothetical protein